MIEFDILGVDGVTNYKFDYAYGTGLTEEQNNKLERVLKQVLQRTVLTQRMLIKNTPIQLQMFLYYNKH